MTRDTTRIALKNTLFLLPILILGGCIEYTLETTLHPDGSGTRTVRVEASDEKDLADYQLSTSEFRDLLSLSENKGWDHETHVSSGDTTHVFRLMNEIHDLSSWSQLDAGIRIGGALPSRSGSTIGYVTLGDVQFRNRVLVGTSRKSDGSSSFSYMETFLWDEAVDALLELLVVEVDRNLRSAYPTLPAQDRGEVLGIARARFGEAVEDGVLDTSGDEEDRLWGRAAERAASQAIRVVQKTNPEVEQGSLRALLNIFSDESEERLIESLINTLPGFSLAINTEISFQLTLPGKVTNTNAHERHGNTLRWEFTPMDAMTAPVVILAESVVGG